MLLSEFLVLVLVLWWTSLVKRLVYVVFWFMPATRRRACSGSTIGISGSESESGLCSLFCIVYTSIARLMSFELMLWANTKSKANMTYVRLTQRVRCTLATIATGRTEVNFRFPFQSLPDTSQILSLRQRYKILPEMLRCIFFRFKALQDCTQSS